MQSLVGKKTSSTCLAALRLYKILRAIDGKGVAGVYVDMKPPASLAFEPESTILERGLGLVIAFPRKTSSMTFVSYRHY